MFVLNYPHFCRLSRFIFDDYLSMFHLCIDWETAADWVCDWWPHRLRHPVPLYIGKWSHTERTPGLMGRDDRECASNTDRPSLWELGCIDRPPSSSVWLLCTTNSANIIHTALWKLGSIWTLLAVVSIRAQWGSAGKQLGLVQQLLCVILPTGMLYRCRWRLNRSALFCGSAS